MRRCKMNSLVEKYLGEKLKVYPRRAGRAFDPKDPSKMSSLAFEFDPKDTAKISGYLKKNFREDDNVADAVAQTKAKEKYSEVLSVQAGPYLVGLYSSYGVWRVGMSGGFSSHKFAKEAEALLRKEFGI
jgi:hypothetical protein